MHVALVALPAAAGQNSYVEALARHLPDDVTSEVRRLRRREVGWGRWRLGRTASLWFSYRSAARPPADLLHATDTFCAVRGAGVVTVHDLIPLLESREPAAWLHFRLFGRRLRAARRIITPSRHWARRAARTLRLDPERIRVVPQGCDARRLRPDFSPVPGVVPGRRHVLYAGAYRPYKRVDALVRALEGTGVRLVRVGPEGRPGYARHCRRLARRLGVELVDLGYVPAGRMAAYYTQADAVFAASREEGFGLAPLEAMACGTPSVLSGIPVYREVYGDLAHYARGAGPADLRAAIQEAMDGPADPTRLRRHALSRDWAATARRTAGVYREALEAGPSG